MPLYPPHWAPPHARCRPCGAPFQYGCFSAPQSCARVFVSHVFALGARFRRRALVASLPLPLRRALAPWPHRRPQALRGGLTRQCGARGLVGSRGCTSTPAATCLRNPYFHGLSAAAHWWLQRGTATRALVLVGWLTRWMRAVVGRSQAGWAAAHATRPCSGCPHPPPDRFFGGRKLDRQTQAHPLTAVTTSRLGGACVFIYASRLLSTCAGVWPGGSSPTSSPGQQPPPSAPPAPHSSPHWPQRPVCSQQQRAPACHRTLLYWKLVCLSPY